MYENAREYDKSGHYCKEQHRLKSMCRSLKKVHGLMAEDKEEECPFFVGSLTSEVQIRISNDM